jgi:hypothetical protein
MRKLMTLTMAFVVLAGVFCGGKTGSQAPATVEKFPVEATSALTDEAIVQFVKVLPAFSAALKAGSWTPAQPKEGDSPVNALTSFVEGMNVPGVDDSLKKVGSSWSALRPTLYKVFAASAALSIDAASPQAIEQMKKDTSAAAKKAAKYYETFKAACSRVPAGNKQTLTRHQQELQLLQTLGR